MSDTQSTLQLILDSGEKIFSDHCDKQLLDRAETGEFADTLWQQIVANGFNQLGASGSGTTARELYAFIMQCGRFAVPLPIAETLLVNSWLEPGEGLYSVGMVSDGQIIDVPWGRRADKVVGVRSDSSEVVVIDQPTVVEQRVNLAGEPRDILALPESAPTIDVTPEPFAQLALTRVNMMAGALQTLLDLGITFAMERSQFGRPIAKFQAIQHSLAIVASEVAAARRAADAGVDGLYNDRFLPEVAASKSRVGEAVTVAAEQIHQIHGAMGFTHEHRLHHFSRRAWAWRDEYGNEFHWQQLLGNHLAALGADNLWSFIATRG
ncbi:MAG: acyl-CoA dehydrogenase family protein [bacterium]